VKDEGSKVEKQVDEQTRVKEREALLTNGERV
jgi:hypothetical protein